MFFRECKIEISIIKDEQGILYNTFIILGDWRCPILVEKVALNKLIITQISCMDDS
jgi:hypothetical protein